MAETDFHGQTQLSLEITLVITCYHLLLLSISEMTKWFCQSNICQQQMWKWTAMGRDFGQLQTTVGEHLTFGEEVGEVNMSDVWTCLTP